ncbi:MAG: AAA family ATPase [Desulfovibrio sp.]|jgi:predicted ATP-dependent protease|nr:AAA family ATPase [Desulfovibrio sp.]
MTFLAPLPAAKLSARLDSGRIPHETSASIPRRARLLNPQQRAFQALEIGLRITAPGFNIYLAGEPELGRTYLLQDYLRPKARKGPTPPDLVYIYNFADTDSPRLLLLPAGQGNRLKSALTKILPRIQKEISLRLDRNAYLRRRTSLRERFHSQRETLLSRMNRIAETQGFNLGMDDAGAMTLYPLLEGKRLTEQDFGRMAEEQRRLLKIRGDSLVEPMTGFLRQLARAEQNFMNEERSLERDVLEEVLTSTLDPLVERFRPLSSGLDRFFADLRTDTLDNLESLIPPDPASSRQAPSPDPAQPSFDDLSARYAVNVFVDNSETAGAPVIFEDHPTLSNLMGCIEREAEMGALVTDFTLIQAGSLHKANGGFLVLRVEDLLHHPQAWEAMLRALRAGFSRIEDAGEEDASKTKGLRPERVPLNLKVILVGKEEIFDLLLDSEERFSKLFKIKAHLMDSMPRDRGGIRTYLTHVRRIIEEDSLLHFDRDALAGLVDFGSRLIEDQRRLSLRFPRVRELMVEASALASLAASPLVTREILDKAEKAHTRRANLVEEEYLEEYDRRIIRVVTDGEAVGKVNGLAVTYYGDFEFGLPHQISCTVGAGSGGIIDLERDAQLGGPIHTKAMMILKSYLVRAFAHNKPLVLTGSLGLEQNYAGIEGDSASGAELAALLSALSGAPVRLSLAFTGAVGQSGEIMAVGGVTRKIEGFFEVCRRHGLTGRQGVILPRDNLAHVLLRDEVLRAIDDRQFSIYAVDHISQAMELLTGLPSGRLRKDGAYPRGSLYQRVDARLRELTALSTRKKS